MPLQPSHINRIEKAVEEIIVEEGIAAPGVPIEEIAKSKGLKVLAYDLGSEISGVLVITDGAGTIGINPKDSKSRQRFTIAHELAHFLLHVKPPKNSILPKDELFIDSTYILKFRSNKEYSKTEMAQELEANAFAAALLMPRSIVDTELQKEEYKDLSEVKLVEKLAKVFEVSVPAMTIRLNNLNLLEY